MAEGYINLITPQGGTMAGHGEEAHFPFQVVTSQGVVWLTQVRIHMAQYYCGVGGYRIAPDALQGYDSPQPPRRSLINLMV